MIWQLGVAIAGNWAGWRQLSVFVGNFSTMLARSTAKSNSEEWPTRRSTICWRAGMDSPCWPTIKYFLLNIFAVEQQNIFEQQVTIFIRCAADSVTIITLIVKYQTKILKSLLYICFYFWRCCIKKNFTIDPAYTEISKMSF